MLGVDGVLFDGGVEPEAVALVFAVVEGRLVLFAAPASSAAAAATSTAGTVAALGTILVLVAMAVRRRGALAGLDLDQRDPEPPCAGRRAAEMVRLMSG